MGTVAKAMALLALFDEDRLSLRLSEISKLTGMDKATVHRSLQALCDAGMLEQFGEQRAYRVGPEVLRLANVREAAVPLTESAKLMLAELCQFAGETTHFSVLRNKRLVRAAHKYSRNHAMGVMMGGADSHPIHATSSGLAILAFSNDAFINDILTSDLKQYTAKTLTDEVSLRKAIARVRKLGFSESNGAFEEGIHSFSAPVFDSSARPFAALSIAAPSSRVKSEHRKAYPESVVQAALQLTNQIGGSVPSDFPLSRFEAPSGPRLIASK